MKKLLCVLITVSMLLGCFPVFTLAAADYKLFLKPADFESNLGTWTIVTNEQGAVDQTALKGMAQEAGAPKPQTVAASYEFTVPADGDYTFYVRTRDYAAGAGTRRSAVLVDGTGVGEEVGKHGTDGWAWEIAGTISLKSGRHTLELKETTSFARVGAVCITNTQNYMPSNQNEDIQKLFADPNADIPSAPAPTPKPTPVAATTPAPTPAALFNDITSDYSWANWQIEELANSGVIKGKAEGTFAPQDSITRAEFITLCVNLTGAELEQYGGAFADVQASHWYADYLQTAQDLGLIDAALAPSGAISPETPITREEMTAVIIKTYEALNGSSAPVGHMAFADAAQIAPYAANSVASAVTLGIIAGVGDNRFAPKDNADRAQAAVILKRLQEAPSGQTYLYVSPDGKDDNPGILDAPLQTLPAAVQKANGKTVVFLREGTYSLAEPVAVTKNDITFQAYPGETPVISGGLAIEGGWEPYQGEIYKTKLPSGVNFRQLYINGTKAVRSRYPNENLTFTKERTDDGFLVAPFPTVANYKDKLELQCYSTWMHKILRVSNITPQGEDTLLTINPIEWKTLVDGIANKTQGSTNYINEGYWLENALEFIDMPYEWYFDTDTSELYVQRPAGKDLNEMTVTVPVSQGLIQLEGTEDQYLSHVTFDGITFTYAGWNRPSEYGFVDVQANSILPKPDAFADDPQFRHNLRKEKITGAINANYVENITISNCVFSHLGTNGVTFDLGGSNTTINGNLFYDISGNGLEVGNDCYKPNDLKVVPKNVVVSNNYIYDVSNDFHGGIGLFVMYADGASIENNTVSHVPYTGINASWGWDSPQSSPAFTQNIIIRRNRVEYYAQKTVDTGAIYMPNPVWGINRVEYNYIKGGYTPMAARSVNGIYHDGNSQNWTDTNNVIENVYQWVISGSATTDKRNNIAVHNFVNTPAEGAIMNGENNYHKDTVEVSRYDWPQEALNIMESAGTIGRYADLKSKMDGLILGEAEQTITFLSKNEDKQLKVSLTNQTQEQQELLVTGATGNKILDDVNQTVTIGPKETKDIYVTASQQKAEGLIDDKLVVSMNGKQYMIPVAISSSSISDADKVYTWQSDCYKEEGNWFDSTLIGYDNTKTRYGQDPGAKASWTPKLTGTYQVSYFNLPHDISSEKTILTVTHAGGETTKVINAQTEPQGFLQLGTFTFTGAEKEGLTVALGSEDQCVRTSAVKFEFVE